MGALGGSITTTAYYVQTELPKDFRERYLASMVKRCFRPVDVDAEHDEAFGWANVADALDTELEAEKVWWGDYLIVALRQEVLRVPPGVFKLHLRSTIAKQLEASGKERLSKAEQEDIRDHLQRQLRKRILPNVKVHDMVWNLNRGVVWLFTANKRVNEVFQEVFQATFDLPLIPKSPYAAVEQMDEPELLDRLLEIEPANFVGRRR